MPKGHVLWLVWWKINVVINFYWFLCQHEVPTTIVREPWQDFSGLIEFEGAQPYLQNCLNSCFSWFESLASLPYSCFQVVKSAEFSFISLFKVLSLVLPEVHNLLIIKMATAKLKQKSYPNLLLLISCRLGGFKNYTEQSYMSIKYNDMMSYSFSPYFFSNKYSKIRSGALAQVCTSSLCKCLAVSLAKCVCSVNVKKNKIRH